MGETERCRAIFEIATNQPVLDAPERVWKAFIDFEIEHEERDRAKAVRVTARAHRACEGMDLVCTVRGIGRRRCSSTGSVRTCSCVLQA